MAKYWFRQKRIGFGSTPNTWQGWTLTLVGVMLIFLVVIEAKQISDRTTQILVALSGVALVVIPMLVISYFQTEGGWRWRNGRDD